MKAWTTTSNIGEEEEGEKTALTFRFEPHNKSEDVGSHLS
jgi:hypothetical protein